MPMHSVAYLVRLGVSLCALRFGLLGPLQVSMSGGVGLADPRYKMNRCVRAHARVRVVSFCPACALNV